MAATHSVGRVFGLIAEPLKHIHAMPAFSILFSSRPVQSPTKLSTAIYSTLSIPISPSPSFESTPVASFLLNECGFSLDEANTICRRKPYLLAKESYDNSRQTLHFFRDKGFNEINVRKVFSRYPDLLRSSFEGIVKPKVSFLQSVLDPYPAAVVSNPESDKIVGMNPDFHKIAGKAISNHSLTTSVILNSPRVLLSSHKRLVWLVKDVEEMGIEKGSKAFARAFLHLSMLNRDTVKVKLGNLRELGFTEEEVGILLKRFPQILGFSKDKLRQKLKFLDEEWKLPCNAIMGHPAALSYSIEKRLKPRLNALRDFMMMNKSSEKEAMSYSPLYYISMSNGDFHRKVVSRLPGE